MDTKNKPLTAEEIKKSWSDWNFEWKGAHDPTTFDAFNAGAECAAQQAVALREELEKYKREVDHQMADNTVLKQRYQRELEAVKKQRDELQKQLTIANETISNLLSR